MKPQVIKEKMKKFASRSNVIKLSIIVSITLMLAFITGALYFRNSAYITDNGVVKEIKTNETQIEKILSEADIVLLEGDKTTFEKDDDNNIYITISRAFDVNVIADGKTHTLKMTQGTVADALSEAGIELGENDIVSEDLDAEVFGGIEIKVSRVEIIEREVEIEIDFETEYVDSSNLKIGTQNVVREGEKGIKTVYYQSTYIDGSFSSTVKTGEKTVKEPVNEIIHKGTSLQVPYAKLSDDKLDKVELVNGLPENYVKVVSGKATAYSAHAGSLTASGRYAVVGTVAVNPNIIPYGSELYIVAQDGSRVYGYAIAADTGIGLMDGRVTVDVFTGSYADSCKWGAIYVDVYVLSLGDNKYISASQR